ncbi:MAG TPA: SufD family Fe-S cluster assembly protein, partial [Pirellulales bacterium]
MSTIAKETGFTAASFDAFLESRDEPAWLKEQRRAAWRAFESLPMPSRTDEEWMRTDIRLLRLNQFAPPVGGSSSDALPEHVEPSLMQGVKFAATTAALDSRPLVAGQPLPESLANRGVLFGSLDELVGNHSDLIQRHLFRAINPEYDKFAALHAAFWSGGAILYVPRGVVIEEPFHVLSAISPGGADFGHILVILDEGAEATLLSETAGGGPSAAGLHCGGIELFVGPGAKLRYVNLQNWGQGVWHFARQKGLVDRDGALQWTIGALGSRLAKVNQHVALVGPGADTQVNGVMFTEGKQHLR